MSDILHGLAYNLAGKFLFNLTIVLFVALVSHNHYWHLDSIAACLVCVKINIVKIEAGRQRSRLMVGFSSICAREAGLSGQSDREGNRAGVLPVRVAAGRDRARKYGCWWRRKHAITVPATGTTRLDLVGWPEGRQDRSGDLLISARRLVLLTKIVADDLERRALSLIDPELRPLLSWAWRFPELRLMAWPFVIARRGGEFFIGRRHLFAPERLQVESGAFLRARPSLSRPPFVMSAAPMLRAARPTGPARPRRHSWLAQTFAAR